MVASDQTPPPAASPAAAGIPAADTSKVETLDDVASLVISHGTSGIGKAIISSASLFIGAVVLIWQGVSRLRAALKGASKPQP